MSDDSLSGQTAFIAGGTRGIGLAIARRILEKGGSVVACSRSGKVPKRDCVDLIADAARYRSIVADVLVEELLESAIEQSDSAAAPLRSMVYCAGAPVLGTGLSLSMQDWDKCMDLNLRAAFAATKYALPSIIRNGGGAIVFVSSIWATTTPRERVAYVTAKTALTGLARSLALDHAADNVRVNCVAPGFVETGLLKKSLMRDAEDPESAREQLIEKHPLGRLISPDDVAQTVAFLIGEGARNITAQTIYVDGGISTAFGSM